MLLSTLVNRPNGRCHSQAQVYLFELKPSNNKTQFQCTSFTKSIPHPNMTKNVLLKNDALQSGKCQSDALTPDQHYICKKYWNIINYVLIKSVKVEAHILHLFERLMGKYMISPVREIFSIEMVGHSHLTAYYTGQSKLEVLKQILPTKDDR